MRVLLVITSMLLVTVLNAQDTGSLLTRAEEAYRSGDFEIALDNYLEAEDAQSGWQLLYNIGNCYYELNETALAVLYYERSLKLNPRSTKARQNLELAKAQIPDRVVAINEFFLVKWMKAASILVPLYLWGGILIALCVVLSLLLVRVIREERWVEDRLKVTALAVTIILAIGPAVYARQQYYSNDRGVIMQDSEIHVAPDSSSQISKTVGAGETVFVLEEFDGLYKVRFVNYEIGWVETELVTRI